MAVRVLVVQNDWDKPLGRIAAALLAEGLLAEISAPEVASTRG
jgi:hypothetical protein